MEIDWITVSAQVVNFLILVWLLKRFLYRPVLRAMDRREERIAARLQAAGEREAEAEARLEDYQARKASLARRRDELLEAAQDEAGRFKHRLIDEARQEVDAMRADWQRQLAEEREAFLCRLGERAVVALETMARQALRDLADADLEARVVETFIGRLTTLDAESRRQLSAPQDPLRVATSFPLDPALEARLTAALHEQLGADRAVEVVRASSPLCGIELTSGGRRLGWSLADYLEALHDQLEGEFGQHGALGGKE
ncbi:F0F1 ATP synthase subunit B [Halomonas nitroreducens]|uniref:ATP synthase subunit b n=1 Tax=Halomonas nitroreducens TaxID=447425 RepID=A0A431V8H8_9GAMM|nr:F0F1 ATP synthase subunit B [Halomonas nitroreducens]RTR06982.1 F0F1 ATP synthase subunit B [Halomonas nitroreducens]